MKIRGLKKSHIKGYMYVSQKAQLTRAGPYMPELLPAHMPGAFGFVVNI
jgi:hypothetical protein